MKANMWFVIAGAAVLSACATTSAVVPIGQGVYEIAGSSATAFSSGAAQRVRLIEKAQQYCAGLGKTATIVGAESTNGHVGSYANVNGGSYGYGGGYSSGSSINGTAVTPGQRANADIQFRCE